jgi:hypothetical protein
MNICTQQKEATDLCRLYNCWHPHRYQIVSGVKQPELEGCYSAIIERHSVMCSLPWCFIKHNEDISVHTYQHALCTLLLGLPSLPTYLPTYSVEQMSS